MGFHASRLRGKIDALTMRIQVAEKLKRDPETILSLQRLLADAQAELEALQDEPRCKSPAISSVANRFPLASV